METVAISEFKATCLKLLERIKNTGQAVLITKKGEPIALVTPPPPPTKPKSGFGVMQGTVQIKGDIIEPLPLEDWEVMK